MMEDKRRQMKTDGCYHKEGRLRPLISFCLLLSLLFLSCDGDDSIYRDYPCSFTFDTTLHPLPCQLTAILRNSGQFVKIETTIEQGVRHVRTNRNYDNATEDIMLRNAMEQQWRYALGANNCIIVGVSSYDDHLLVAYEGQCPNCLTDLGGTRYPLMWANNGLHLNCAKCGRSYDVNNGVVAAGRAGKALFRYQAAFDGSILRVWN